VKIVDVAPSLEVAWVESVHSVQDDAPDLVADLIILFAATDSRETYILRLRIGTGPCTETIRGGTTHLAVHRLQRPAIEPRARSIPPLIIPRERGGEGFLSAAAPVSPATRPHPFATRTIPMR
jgi:hypothetical protein